MKSTKPWSIAQARPILQQADARITAMCCSHAERRLLCICIHICNRVTLLASQNGDKPKLFMRNIKGDGCVQVQQSKLVEGEERQLRATLRQLESRRSSVERAGLVHLAVMGDGGLGGVMQGLRTLEGHANAILDQEEAHATLSSEGKFVCVFV